MPRLILTRGIPGSGKSTWAMEWVARSPKTRVRINRDDIRAMLGIKTGIGTPEQEEQVTAIEQAGAIAALNKGFDVVIDATNLNPRRVKEWYKINLVEFQDFPISIDEAIARDNARKDLGGRGVGADVIKSIAKRSVLDREGTLVDPPRQPEPLVFKPAPGYDPNLPLAIIVDIDGTLANHEPHRGPYDTSKYHLDTLHPNVAATVQSLCYPDADDDEKVHMLVTSGRSDEFRDVTEAWLDTVANVDYDEVFMRAAGDMRNDAIVKHDLYHAYIAGKYNVIMVFDDRNRVVDMWRAIGLTCAQVAPGDF